MQTRIKQKINGKIKERYTKKGKRNANEKK